MYSIVVLTNTNKCFLTEKAKDSSISFPLHLNYLGHDLTLNSNDVALYFIKNNKTQQIKAWSKEDGKLVFSNETRITKKLNSIISKVKQISKTGDKL